MRMSTIDLPVTTVAQLLALPEDSLRHELLDGEHVVTPSPIRQHQWVAGELFARIRDFTTKRAGLTTFLAPADVRVAVDTLVQPDIFVVGGETPFEVAAGSEIEIPYLVVEILSPGTAGRDRGKKRVIYQDAGVLEYWIVDIDSRLVERWRPRDQRPEILREKIEWQPDEKVGALAIDLKTIWPPPVPPFLAAPL